jgi:UDP-N-acetylmuramyl tripeptide synthase
LRKDPDAVLVLNADDSLVSSLGLHTPNRKVWFGLDMPVGDQSPRVISDALHCIRCGTEYKYHYYTYAHLGSFYCPKCGYSRMKPDFAVEKINRMDEDGSRVTFRIGDATRDVTVGLPAVYNLYNAAGAIAAYVTFGGKADDICHSLSTVHSSFGRMEKFDLPRQTILERADKVSGKAAEAGTVSKADMEAVPGERSEAAPEEKNKTENAETEKTVPVRMILVKNPAGCSQTIDYLSRIDEDFLLVICLNDRTADGHDISWIWDADYERLSENTHIQSMIVSGDRAEDLRVRLKYAGIDEKKIAMEKDNESLLSSMRSSTLPVFVMPNYTSMLALRKILSDATGKREFWEKQSDRIRRV